MRRNLSVLVIAALISSALFTASPAGAEPDNDVQPPRATLDEPAGAPSEQGGTAPVVDTPPAEPPAPPPIDAAALEALAAAARAAAVREAERISASETAAAQLIVDHANTTLAASREAVAAAQLDVESVAQRVAAAEANAGEAQRVAQAARADVAQIGVEMFQSVGTNTDMTVVAARARLEGPEAYHRATTLDIISSQLAEKATTAFRDAQAEQRDAESAVLDAREQLEAAQQRVSELGDDVTAAEQAVREAAQQLDVTRERAARRVAAAQRGEEVPTASLRGGITVEGPNLVEAADMAAFVHARGIAHPSVDVDELARFFVEEGQDQGVRADVAWVQSIIETGWFSFRNSMVHPNDHNYAGIGACDSCRRGIRYTDPRSGARAQMQLLATYADPTLTSDTLAHPPVRLRPERSWVRGCCATWVALTGVWATDPGYGAKILTLYNELLRFAAARRTPT